MHRPSIIRHLAVLACALAAAGPLVAQSAPRGYQADNEQAFSSRIAGKTASPSVCVLFSGGDLTAGTGLVWNPGRWCADVDLTCFSPWNSLQAYQQGGTLITPRHIVLANHFSNPATGTPPMVPGKTTIKFVAADNTIHTRTITAFARAGNTDVLIGTLDRELPASIKPAKILPADTGSFTSRDQRTFPALVTSRQKQARIACATVSSKAGGNTVVVPYKSGPFAPWSADPLVTVGDSGSPIFFIIGGEVYLDSVFFTTLGGDRVAGQLDAINAILGPSYALKAPAFKSTPER